MEDVTNQTLAAGVDDRDQESTDGKPDLGIVGVPVSEGDDPCPLGGEDGEDGDDGLDGEEEEVHVEGLTGDDPFVDDGHHDGRSAVGQDGEHYE